MDNMRVQGGVGPDGLRYLATPDGTMLKENEVPPQQFEALWSQQGNPQAGGMLAEMADDAQWSGGEMAGAGALGLGAAAMMPWGIGKAVRGGLGTAGKWAGKGAMSVGGQALDAGNSVAQAAGRGMQKLGGMAEESAMRSYGKQAAAGNPPTEMGLMGSLADTLQRGGKWLGEADWRNVAKRAPIDDATRGGYAGMKANVAQAKQIDAFAAKNKIPLTKEQKVAIQQAVADGASIEEAFQVIQAAASAA